VTQRDDANAETAGEPICDCGYRSRGPTLPARVRDAQDHACAAHGIDVTAEQVLVHVEGGAT
jgi:hypothetical protein